MDFTVLDPPLNVLVVHGDVPPPDRDACSLRLLRIVEQMVAEGHRVTFLARGGADQIHNSARLLQMGVAEVFPLDAVRLGERFPERSWRFTIETLDLKWLLDRGNFDVAWLSLYDIAEQYTPLLREHSPATRVVVDSSDIQWIREHRGATLAGDPTAIAAAERTRERERAVYGAADVNVAISEVDGQATRELAPDVPVQIVSLVEDFPTVVADRSARSGLLFVGNFWHAPNVDAVTAFHRDTWPLVRAAVPGIHLTVAGSAPPEEIVALAAEDVTVTGWVPELEPYMAQAMISIAPLRYGAGIKGKIVQAIAAGLPVVTTTIGTEGMGLTDGEHLLVADDPADFAAAIARLHTDELLWYRLATEAPEPLASRMGPEAARAGVRRSLRAACPVRWQARADGERLGELLITFTRDHVAGDPITLTLTVPADDPEAPQAAFERVTAIAAELAIDLDDTADIQIVPWAPGTDPLPRTVMLDAAPSAATASAPTTPAATGRRGAPRPKVAIALQGALGPRHLHAQLELLGPAIAGHDAEVVVIAFGHNGATSKMLAAQSGARIVRTDKHPGREQAQRLAIEATSAPVLITLGPMALPQPGLVGPLLEALDGNASFAGAGIDAEHGLHVGADGSLWPLRTGDPRPITALSFDCLAATREVWQQAPVSLPMREGLPERQLAEWALQRGPLAVHPSARVHRIDSGPVSVIICTRNRAEELPDAVALLAAHGSTVNGNEVIIVDNGSTDATPDVARELATRYPGVRVVHEDNPGLSHARNAGARAAANAHLCYLDDDARPAPGWRQSIAWGLRADGIVAAGGPIAALWPAEREPAWPSPGLEGALSVLDAGELTRVLTPPEIVYGANWAIRKEALMAVGGFDGHLGYAPDVKIGSEEVAVAWRLHLRGLGGTVYIPGAAVGHRISADRLNDDFLVSRMFAVGIEHAHLRVEREGRGHQRLISEAGTAAADLLGILPLAGEMELEEALDRVKRSDLPVTQRTRAAEALGLLSASVLLLEERTIEAGDLSLRLRPEHLRGVLHSAPSLTTAS
jgi:GT2 family glycosyltransferase/glycosyltransferase involved in cell wall biosynthesis